MGDDPTKQIKERLALHGCCLRNEGSAGHFNGTVQGGAVREPSRDLIADA